MADAESTRAPGSPQQAGAEIVRRCGNCEHRYAVPDVLGRPTGIAVCADPAVVQLLTVVPDKHTCDHWRKRGAE